MKQLLRRDMQLLPKRGAGSLLTRSLSTSIPFRSDSSSAKFRGKINNQADVVVIGGGVLGCSVLYHLTKAGYSDVMLLEKNELTSGSTWHAAGLVTWFHPGANMRNIHYYSLTLFPELEKETGQELGFHRPGSIRLYESEERMTEALQQMGKSKLWPANQKLISPVEIKELHPLVNIEGLMGGIYNPNDGHIDPSSLTNAFAIGARAGGAQIHRPVTVKDLIERDDGKWDVVTNVETITAKAVVNCGGLWGNQVSEMAGVPCPQVPIQHQYAIIAPIAEVVDYQKEHGHQLPVLRDLKGSYYIRQERDGLLVGPYEDTRAMKVCTDWTKTGVPPEWGIGELFDEDTDRIMPHLQHAMERLPCITEGELAEKTGLRSVVNGPVSWPADGNPFVGPVVGKRNYWQCSGASYGIAHSGGIGKYLVDWMKDGEPPYELIELDPERYGLYSTTGREEKFALFRFFCQ